MKELRLNWGCYIVLVQYKDMHTYDVFYYGGNYDRTPYRKLTAPERDAVEVAIRTKENVTMNPPNINVNASFRSDSRKQMMRDQAALSILRSRMDKIGITRGALSPKVMAELAEESYKMADALLLAREKTNICDGCGKEKTQL